MPCAKDEFHCIKTEIAAAIPFTCLKSITFVLCTSVRDKTHSLPGLLDYIKVDEICRMYLFQFNKLSSAELNSAGIAVTPPTS